MSTPSTMDPYYIPAHFQAFRAEDPRNASCSRFTSGGCIQHIGKDTTKQVPTFSSGIQGYAAASHNISLASQTGPRTTRIIMSPPFEKCTSLTTGESFIKAWFEVVTCHAFLWKNCVEHGDHSLSNMIYDPKTKYGVLTDFDLALLQWELRIIGTDRTGTIPFMAIGLLCKDYWEGKLKRYYHHELESFFWMLPFLFLSYNDGKRQPNRYIDAWRTSNYDVCGDKKSRFHGITLQSARSTIQPDYKSFWTTVDVLISHLDAILSTQRIQHDDIRTERDMKLQDVMADQHRADSDNMWESFIKALKTVIKIQPLGDEFSDALEKLKSVKPDFIDLSDEQKVALRERSENDGN